MKRLVVLLCVVLLMATTPGVASAGGADVRKGDVSALDAATTDIDGWAKIKRHRGETEVTIKLTGLIPNGQYHGHLHVGVCADEGPHYKDDPDGAGHPPNELHLMTFTARANGTAVVKADASWVAREEARSVFLHAGPAGHHSPKVACGEFPTS